MPEGRSYIKWCLKQKKGIKVLKPSDNLVKGYLGKSRDALRSMNVNAAADIADWTLAASYYAKYFAVYALLWKLGVKCEIHDCTIALFLYLFGDRFPRDVIDELKESKASRIEAQYYTNEIRIDFDLVTRKSKAFVLRMEELIETLTRSELRELQQKLEEL